MSNPFDNEGVWIDPTETEVIIDGHINWDRLDEFTNYLRKLKRLHCEQE